MKTYSMDLRERVLDIGMEVRQIAVKYRVSKSWIRRLKQRRRQPDVTLHELAERLGHALSGQTLSRALRASGLTLKQALHAAEQDHPA